MLILIKNENSRVVREDAGSDEASPFWWCDPGQAGYGFYLAPGIKTWCEENGV